MKKLQIIILLNMLSTIVLNAQAWQMEVTANEKIGIGAGSQSNYGGIFLCIDKSRPDLVIAGNPSISFGDDCVLAADPTIVSSDLFLQANDDVIIELDKNNDAEPAKFQIKNGVGNIVYDLDDGGSAKLTGDQSVMEMKSVNHLNGSVLVLRNDSPTLFNSVGAINFQIAGNTPGQIAYSSNQTMDIRVNHNSSFMSLGGLVNDITMANGAKLNKSGVWTNAPAPVSTARNSANTVDPEAVLEAVRVLPIYYWTTKEKDKTQHLTPAADEFYAAFGCGEDDQHLAPSDLAAVALAAVQALQRENQELKDRLTKQEKQIAILAMKWARLESNVDNLKK